MTITVYDVGDSELRWNFNLRTIVEYQQMDVVLHHASVAIVHPPLHIPLNRELLDNLARAQ